MNYFIFFAAGKGSIVVTAGGKEMQDPLEITVMKVLLGIARPCVEVAEFVQVIFQVVDFCSLSGVCFPGKREAARLQLRSSLGCVSQICF